MPIDIDNLLKDKDPTLIYGEQRQFLIDKYNYEKEEEDAKSLQKYLQGKYYGDTEKVQQLIKRTKALLDADNGRVLSENFTSFDINPAAQKVAEEEMSKEILHYYTTEKAARNQKMVSLKGIQDKLTTLIHAETLFKNSGDDIEYNNFKNQLDTILIDYYRIIKDYFGDLKEGKFINFADNPDLEFYVKTLNDFYFAYIKQIADKPNMKLIGDTFEYSMGIIAAGLENATIEEIYSRKEELLTKYVTGSSGKTSELNPLVKNGNQIQLTLDKEPLVNKKTGKLQKKFEIKLDKDFSIEVNISQLKPFDFKSSLEKQGKADVIFNIPTVASKPLNLSLKNWANLSSQYAGFKSSNLGLTIAKIIDNDNFYAYIFQLAQYRKKSIENDWHKVAKISLISDTVMGANQVGTYGDMLVINDRQHKDIIVLPFGKVASAIDSIVEIDKGFKGYNKEKIKNNLKSIWKKNHNKYGGTNTILLEQNYLSRIKVELRYSSLFAQYGINKSNNISKK